ncbi:MAG TPA: CocE/NonD family hydrolase [Conexibacter sp.]|nr:CocE/NonD family hydrolase [Conexibacter sp.]
MSASTPPPAAVTVELDVPARMRDGVTLRANVYRPSGTGPWPTLLARLPYRKDDPRLMSFWLDPIEAARHGFMVVVQDTRGRFASEGEWLPFRYEREDGYDTVEWAARLPGSNGRVGMYGPSYFGNTQWLAAIEQPPSLASISPACTWSEPLDGLLARGGALEFGVSLHWGLETGAGHVALKVEGSDEERARAVGAVLDDYDRLAAGRGYEHLPAHESTVVSRHGVPDLGSLRMATEPDVPAWCRVAGQHERVTVPSFHIGGWYDIFLQGTLDNYVAMAALGRPSRLLVGPWGHEPEALSDPIGELRFGIRAGALGVPAHPHGDVTGEQLAWHRRYLTPDAAPQQEPDETPVRIFVMGRNEWRDERAWPLERAREERWFLGAGGDLLPGAARDGDEPTTFVYDPADPVPTVGGHVVLKPTVPSGPFDQAGVEAREDVCVFTSEPLREELEVTGRVRVVLHAESSAPSTDWVARLCDVHPDGRSFNLCDGILRVVEGADAPRRVEIDLWSTSNVFLAGHRLRVHVTSSSFPRWDRNLNTGDQRDARFEVARQRIHHDAERPSYIELPVVAS